MFWQPLHSADPESNPEVLQDARVAGRDVRQEAYRETGRGFDQENGREAGRKNGIETGRGLEPEAGMEMGGLRESKAWKEGHDNPAFVS